MKYNISHIERGRGERQKILTEDFNFIPRVVEWVNSEKGVLPNVNQVIHQKN